MINNDILRSLRYSFDFSDQEMIDIFALGDKETTREEVCAWLKKEDHLDFVFCEDHDFCAFLNGFINLKRGKQEGAPVREEQELSNNLVLKKIKIALSLKSEEVLALLQLVEVKMSKHELSALFRQKGHKNYKECKGQFLRNFLKGLQKKYRPSKKGK